MNERESGGTQYCSHGGSEVGDHAVVCVKCGAAAGKNTQPATAPAPAQHMAKSRVADVLLGIFLGGLGLHNCYAGFNGKAIAQLLISLLLGGLVIPLVAVGIWVIVEVIVVEQDAQDVAFV